MRLVATSAGGNLIAAGNSNPNHTKPNSKFELQDRATMKLAEFEPPPSLPLRGLITIAGLSQFWAQMDAEANDDGHNVWPFQP